MARVEITPRERLWLAVASLAIMLATFAPYAVSWINSTPEMRYGGFLYAHEDMHSYLAKMRYGARDGWLFELVYTSEPHRGAFVFPFHLGLGKLTALLAGQPPPVPALVITYHIARLLFGLLALVVTYRFVAEFLAEVSQRRLAWTLATLGGGLGWLVLILFGSEWLGSLPNEFYIPEGYTFLTLLLLPHLSLARSLLLLGWLALLRAAERGSWRLATLAGLAWLAMGVVVPFYVALIGVLLAAWLAALWLRTRQLPLREGLLAGLAGALSGLTLIYNYWAFTTDPVFQTWSTQNRLPSPHPLHYLFGYGLLAALAAFGLRRVWRGEERRATLLVSWLLIVPVLVYLPINVQRRLAEGVLVPLSIIAVVGLSHLAANWPPRRKVLAHAALLALLLPSSLVLALGGALSLSAPRWPVYHTPDELAALAWLEEHAAPEAIVLSSFEQGNVLPAYADVRVYGGHGPETVDSARKEEELRAFFGAEMADAERLSLLAASRARYVFVGPLEMAYCDGSLCFDPAALGLEPVYTTGDYTIYEVTS